MPVKMLQDVKNDSRPPVLGYISTGLTVTRTRDDGRVVDIPTQVDHFVLPENLKAFYERRGLAPEPKVIEGVYLVYDDIDQEYFTQFRKSIKTGTKSKCVCWGDDVSERATRITLEKRGGETVEVRTTVTCMGSLATDPFCEKCKDAPIGHLYIIIPDFEEYGVFVVQSKSVKTHYAITRALWGLKNAGIPYLRNIPFKLEAIPFTANHDGKSSIRYYIDARPMISNRDVLEISKRLKDMTALPAPEEPIALAPPPEDAVTLSDSPLGEPEESAEERADVVESLVGEVVEEEDPFGPDANPPAAACLSKIQVQTLEKERRGVISDAKWTAALTKYCGVTKTADVPQKIVPPTGGEPIDAFEYLCRAIKTAAKKGDNRPAAVCVCASCGAEVDESACEKREDGLICKDCAELAENLGIS